MRAEKPAKVGALIAACVLISNAVGSGVFTTTGFMARDLGNPGLILLLWAAGGALAFGCGATEKISKCCMGRKSKLSARR